MSKTRYCARHPDTQTSLSCTRCEESICPRCMVHAPVGVRCPNCAQARRVPTFDVSRLQLARAIAVGLVLAAISGIVAGILVYFVLFPFIEMIAMAGAGYLIGEGISAAVNRKRGRSLRLVAAGSVFVAFVAFSFVLLGVTLPGLFGLGIAVYIAINRF